MPQEYVELEKRVDAIRLVQQQLSRLGMTVYEQPAFPALSSLQPTATYLTERVGNLAQNLQQFALGPDQPFDASAGQSEADRPKNLEQAFAQICYKGAEDVSLEEPYGAALMKYAQTMEKVGEEHLHLCKDATAKFVAPVNATLATTIQQAMLARKRVQSARLRLDAVKSRFKATRPDRQETVRPEVERAEDEFVALVEEAMTLMKAVVEDPEPLRNLADLLAAQLAYSKRVYEMLQEVSPEIDELQVTQEALYRNSHAQDD